MALRSIAITAADIFPMHCSRRNRNVYYRQLYDNYIDRKFQSTETAGSSQPARWKDFVRDGFIATVGRTPLIKLQRFSAETGCDILAKAEFLNPGGSVKDRAALYLLKSAFEKNQFDVEGPPVTIVEGTAGNTGIGLAHMCRAAGFNIKIFMPDNQSAEKIDILRLLGAEVTSVPVVPYTDPKNYNHQAREYAESHPNHLWTNQFDNVANRQAHYETTGPEIWLQTAGNVDAFVCGTGTGGTVAGTGSFLKERNPNVKIVLADPEGSVLYNYFTNGELERTPGNSITEGIGQGRVTDNLNGAPIDDALAISDVDAVKYTFRLLCEEGFWCGASTGLNIAAAVEVARRLGPGHTVVTILCDNGRLYYNKLFSRNVMKEKKLLHAVPEEYRYVLH